MDKELNVNIVNKLDSKFLVKEFYDFTVTDTLN